MQVNEAAEIIYDLVDPSANLIFGAVIDPTMSQEVQITLIATGFGGTSPTTQNATPGAAAVARGDAVEGAQVAAIAEAGAAVGAGATNGGSGIRVPEFLRRRQG